MAISVADNFSYKGGKPLDARTKYDSVVDMKNATASDLYDGCLAYVVATKKNYQYDSSNTIDPDTGKWRELETGGGGGTTYTAGDGIEIEDDEISVKEMASEDMSEIIDPIPLIPSGVSIKKENNIVWVDNNPVLALDTIAMYVNPQTGVDDYEGGYGFSAAKPFASIDYAQKYMPRDAVRHTAGMELRVLQMHLSGTFTSTNVKQYTFEYPSARFYLIFDGAVVFNNVTVQIFNCGDFIARLNGTLTINITNTSLTSIVSAIQVALSRALIDAPNATSQNPMGIVITGNSTARNYIKGIHCHASTFFSSTTNLSLEINYCDIAYNASNASNCFYLTTKGANNSIVFNATSGSVLAFGNNSATGTTAQKTSYGGRIYTGQQ